MRSSTHLGGLLGDQDVGRWGVWLRLPSWKKVVCALGKAMIPHGLIADDKSKSLCQGFSAVARYTYRSRATTP